MSELVRRKFEPKPILCPQCFRRFKNQGGLNSHISAKHEASYRPPTRSRPAEPTQQGPETNDDYTREVDADMEVGGGWDGDEAGWGEMEIDEEMDPDVLTFGVHNNHNHAVDITDIPTSQENVRDRVNERRKGKTVVISHPNVNGQPCALDGTNATPRSSDDWFPFQTRSEFLLGDFLFRRDQMSAKGINELMQIWSQFNSECGVERGPPFADAKDLYNVIDNAEHGDLPWQSFTVSYSGEEQADDPAGIPTWMQAEFRVWHRNADAILSQQLANSDYAKELDFAPKQVWSDNDVRQYCDLMSGEWAWREADRIYKSDPNLYAGATLCPIILGSDKTTVSVATGDHSYYPIYVSNGLLHNNVRRAHRNGISLLGFLATPKAEPRYEKTLAFRQFRRQLFHSSIHYIMNSVRSAMTVPAVRLFGDGHYRRVVYSLGPYIADYPEQALLAAIVQGWCPRCPAKAGALEDPEAHSDWVRTQEFREQLLRSFNAGTVWDEYGYLPDIVPFTAGFERANIHELLSPDLLHQLIKGTFKDHLVEWVHDFIRRRYGTRSSAIFTEIDRRVAVIPPFPGLRRFPNGIANMKQWTGDDSKALMKVFLPVIAEFLPEKMTECIREFLEFIYIARRDTLDSAALDELDAALFKFREKRSVFIETGIRATIDNLPRQHSMTHYRSLIQDWGAPNGVCSSITESKHIKAVKEPYRRSSKFEALGQMLTTNERLDKLVYTRVDFVRRGMLESSVSGTGDGEGEVAQRSTTPDLEAVDEDVLGEVKLAKTCERNYSRSLEGIAEQIGEVRLVELTQHFLFYEMHHDRDITVPPSDNELPHILSKVYVFHSAVATFYAPSDLSGISGMQRQRIRSSCKSWRGGPPRYDCVALEADPTKPGARGLFFARVKCFFTFSHYGITYPCALVEYFITVSEEPDTLTGMWVAKPEYHDDGDRSMGVVHLNTILRNVHLIPVFGQDTVPPDVCPENALDIYSTFYVSWSMGKRVANIGPQSKFPVHEGILNYRGSNTVAILIWTLEANKTVRPEIELVEDGFYDGGVGAVAVNNLLEELEPVVTVSLCWD